METKDEENEFEQTEKYCYEMKHWRLTVTCVNVIGAFHSRDQAQTIICIRRFLIENPSKLQALVNLGISVR